MEVSNEVEIRLIHTEEERPKIPDSFIIRRLHCRVLSLLCIAILLSYITRNNIGFAANDLCADLDLNNADYGLGATLFFFGTVILQLVTNEFTKRLGAPIWLSLLSLTFGSTGMALGFVQQASQFYGLMTFLGIAQGGFFPALILYLCMFYPPQYLDSAFAAITASVAFSIPITSVVSVALIALADSIGLEGWRMILAAEGAFSVVYSAVLFFALPSSPMKASFLSPEEKQWLEDQLKQEEAPSVTLLETLREALSTFQVQIASLIILCTFGIETVLLFFINLSIRTALNGKEEVAEDVCGTSGGNRTISIVLTAVPYLFAGFVSVFMSLYAHCIKNRKRFAMTLQLVCGVLLVLWAPVNEISFIAGFVVLVLAIGVSFLPAVITFSLAAASVPIETRGTATTVLSLICSVSGLAFPWLIGIVADAYGYGWCIGTTGLLGIVGGLSLMLLFDPTAKESREIPTETSQETADLTIEAH